MLSQAGQVLVQQVDTMMVGAVGTTELAASSFANSVFLIGFVLGMGFTFGLTPITGHAFAAGRHDEAGALLKNSAFTNLVLSLLLVTIMFTVSFFMMHMGQTPDVVKLAIPYYRILVYSMIPFLLFFTLKQFTEGLGNTTLAMWITLGANVVNIILNYLLIFGKAGFEPMGLQGAGISTFIARLLMPLLFLLLLWKKPRFKPYLIYAMNSKIVLSQIKKLFSISWPIAIQMVLEVSAFAMSAVMVGWIGEVSLAAHQIALGLSSIAFMVVSGIGSGTTIRVSHQYSSGNFTALKMAADASIHLTLAFMGCSAMLFLLFRHQLPGLYTSDPHVAKIAANLLIVAAVYQLFDGLQVVMLGVLRGMADVKRAMVYAFLSYIVVNIPISYLLAFKIGLGPIGVWFGFVFGLGLAGVLFLSRFKHIYHNLTHQELAFSKGRL